MRDRETEWASVLDLQESTRRGTSKVLLVEGEPGTGRSLLLASAAEAAAGHGLSVVRGAADELSRFMPLAPLLAALPEFPSGPEDIGAVAASSWAAPNIRAWLEELASSGPTVAIFDDLHLADPGTLYALRTLPGLLAPHPLSWILAGCTDNAGRDAALLFDVLEQESATRIRLQPLSGEAQAGLMTDILRSVPDAALRELAASACGNPSMLTELLRGLLDENAIVISGDHAGLVSRRLPRRLRSVVQARLGRLAPRTRQLLETGAVLGRSFRLEDAAAMLGDTPAGLLAAVEEALTARVLVPAGDTVAFEQGLVCRAVTEAMAPPVRQALHRQAGEMLLGCGGSAVQAADHLLVGAQRGDPVVLAGLDRAVAEALPTAPEAAAGMAVRALELTPPAAEAVAARTVIAVRSLAAAARWDEAGVLVRSALATPMPTLESAQLRSALASLQAISGHPAEALAEAESLLADPDVPGEVRDDAEAALLQALTGLRENRKAARVAEAILEHPGSGDAIVAALLLLALIMWDAGRAGRALDLANQAIRAERRESPPLHRFHPGLFLALRLTDLRRFAEAETIMNVVGRAFTPGTAQPSAASPDVLRARMALATGRMDDAAAGASSVLGGRDVPGTRHDSSIALPILGIIALRRGDLNAAVCYTESPPAPFCHCASAYEADLGRLVAAQAVEARNGPCAAVDRLGDVYASLGEHRYLLMSDPGSAAWLVRTAAAAGDRGRAEAAEAAMAAIHCGNKEIPVYQACAEHARGVLRSDRSSLEAAVALHDDPWYRASAAEDLGVVLCSRDPREAVRWLDVSLDGNAKIGAERDAARVRRRLRRLGVRRRHWRSAQRPATGWDSLTDTQRSTSKLVAQGLTNQQVADQLFISVHTVAFHLRQVFRKLGIGSRVELARITLERSADRGPAAPGGWLIPRPVSCSRDAD